MPWPVPHTGARRRLLWLRGFVWTGRSFGSSIPPLAPGFLCCAAVEALVCCDPKLDAIELVTYEVEGSLSAPLRGRPRLPG